MNEAIINNGSLDLEWLLARLYTNLVKALSYSNICIQIYEGERQLIATADMFDVLNQIKIFLNDLLVLFDQLTDFLKY